MSSTLPTANGTRLATAGGTAKPGTAPRTGATAGARKVRREDVTDGGNKRLGGKPVFPSLTPFPGLRVAATTPCGDRELFPVAPSCGALSRLAYLTPLFPSPLPQTPNSLNPLRETLTATLVAKMREKFAVRWTAPAAARGEAAGPSPNVAR